MSLVRTNGVGGRDNWSSASLSTEDTLALPAGGPGIVGTGIPFRVQGLPRWSVICQGWHNAASASTLPTVEVIIQGAIRTADPFATGLDLNWFDITSLIVNQTNVPAFVPAPVTVSYDLSIKYLRWRINHTANGVSNTRIRIVAAQ